MSEYEDQGIQAWVDEAPVGRGEFREAVRLILEAVAKMPLLREHMVMKGGILMAIRYRSPRFTKDIDFSASCSPGELDPEEVKKAMEQGLALAVAQSDSDLDVKLQGFGVNPKRPDATFPSIEMRIGYARKGTPQHKRLQQGASPAVVSIDFSINERILQSEELVVMDGERITIYKATDLVAEKLRSLLQQKERNRYRRQDIYDLRWLLERAIKPEDHPAVLESLLVKARSRDIEPARDSLSDPEIRQRAYKEYHTLGDEVEGELPDFDASYDIVESFYRALPWQEEGSPPA